MSVNHHGIDTPEWTARLQPIPGHELSKVRQLYLAFYEAITRGDLRVGQRLPSSRELSRQLSVGRNTVIAAYAQLEEELLINGDGRRGTRVSHDSLVLARSPTAVAHSISEEMSRLSHRSNSQIVGARWSSILAPGMPDPSLFPQEAWRSAVKKASRLPAEKLGYQDQSLPRMQASLARYLRIYRSLSIDPEQVIITSSTRQSLVLAATLYSDPGDHAWIESPGYRGAVDAFKTLGLQLRAMQIDAQGSVPCVGTEPQTPKLIYLTPCFQYPSGTPMSAQRRAWFLDYAAKHGIAIFEDDYDSEFRDNSEARPSLASQANGAGAAKTPLVINTGTFSKIIFPAARMAWLVVPSAHIEAAHHHLRTLGGGHTTITQAIIAELLDNGSVAKHLQRARGVYARRRVVMLAALEDTGLFHSLCDTSGSLSMVVNLIEPVPKKALLEQLQKQGLGVQTLESHVWPAENLSRCKSLVLGLGNVSSLQIPETVSALVRALRLAGAARA